MRAGADAVGRPSVQCAALVNGEPTDMTHTVRHTETQGIRIEVNAENPIAVSEHIVNLIMDKFAATEDVNIIHTIIPSGGKRRPERKGKRFYSGSGFETAIIELVVIGAGAAVVANAIALINRIIDNNKNFDFTGKLSPTEVEIRLSTTDSKTTPEKKN